MHRFLENYLKKPAQPSPEYSGYLGYEDLEYVEATGQLLIHLEGGVGVAEVTNLQVRDQLLAKMAITPDENFVPKFKGYKVGTN